MTIFITVNPSLMNIFHIFTFYSVAVTTHRKCFQQRKPDDRQSEAAFHIDVGFGYTVAKD